MGNRFESREHEGCVRRAVQSWSRIAPLLVVALALGATPALTATVASNIAIVLDENAEDIETRVAGVLERRILKRSEVSVEVSKGKASQDATGLHIYLCRAGKGGSIETLCKQYGAKLPGRKKPFAEGFAVKTATVNGVPSILAMGADKRAMLYAVGEILRNLEHLPDAVVVGNIDVSTAPAYRFRGFSANQGGTMMQVTGARAWTAEQWQEYVLDFALAGANFFYAGGSQFDFVKSFDMMCETGCRPNQMRDAPEEWLSPRERGYVCPSIPEARAALLKQWEEDFKNRGDYDVLRFFAGDPGGCRCERCSPWGKTFVLLCEEIANIWLKYHPDSLVQIANQDVTNAGDQAIFDYLNEKPRTWLYSMSYGPGSNAMSSYFRSELREDLFEYPGSGPINRYLAETLNQIPKYQRIVHYSDITHWISSQYMVENPEPNLVAVYGRRTFHTRPMAYYRVFQAIMPFSEGDIIYSEGYHDEFHQYMWNRLLWNPNQSVEEVTDEYTRYHFGLDAAFLMTEAIFQLEESLETPLEANDGIDWYYVLVKEAGWNIPSHLKKDNYRWRLHMQKAALDKYVQLKLRRQLDRETRILRALGRGLGSGDLDGAIKTSLAVFEEPAETHDMKALRDEAGRLGTESEKLFGVRNVGFFNLDKGLVGLDWYKTQLDKAAAAKSEDEKREIVGMIASYEDPGEGGFYDNAGRKGQQPHLIRGESYDASQMMDPTNRPSQNTIAYALADPKGVAFLYEDLDPDASYKVRMTFVQPRIPREMLQLPGEMRRVQTVVADGDTVAKNVEVPEYTARQFEYDIPKRLTKDGALELSIVPGTGAPAAVVSEVWLRKVE